MDLDRIKKLLLNFRLPTHFDLDASELLDAMKKDKKKAGDTIHFILLNKIGSALVENISYDELKIALAMAE